MQWSFYDVKYKIRFFQWLGGEWIVYIGKKGGGGEVEAESWHEIQAVVI